MLDVADARSLIAGGHAGWDTVAVRFSARWFDREAAWVPCEGRRIPTWRLWGRDGWLRLRRFEPPAGPARFELLVHVGAMHGGPVPPDRVWPLLERAWELARRWVRPTTGLADAPLHRVDVAVDLNSPEWSTVLLPALRPLPRPGLKAVKVYGEPPTTLMLQTGFQQGLTVRVYDRHALNSSRYPEGRVRFEAQALRSRRWLADQGLNCAGDLRRDGPAATLLAEAWTWSRCGWPVVSKDGYRAATDALAEAGLLVDPAGRPLSPLLRTRLTRFAVAIARERPHGMSANTLARNLAWFAEVRRAITLKPARSRCGRGIPSCWPRLADAAVAGGPAGGGRRGEVVPVASVPQRVPGRGGGPGPGRRLARLAAVVLAVATRVLREVGRLPSARGKGWRRAGVDRGG